METPVPKIPFEETPTQLDKITPIKITNINLNFIFYF
jgi:hypothetical protein